jgi:hypothetical protein
MYSAVNFLANGIFIVAGVPNYLNFGGVDLTTMGISPRFSCFGRGFNTVNLMSIQQLAKIILSPIQNTK